MTRASPPLRISWRRRAGNLLMLGLCLGALAVALALLGAILVYVAVQGSSSLSWTFLTSTPRPAGEAGGGMGNAIAGSLLLIGLASVIGLPLGIGAGIYLAEYGRGALATAIRFWADVLTGIPSITIGLFVYALLVVPLRTFSALAGGVALGVIMLPIVTRTTEEMIRLVPGTLREGALALGIPRWKVIVRVVLPTALGGIVTGALLGVARIAGETAPLLFTAFGNQFWSWSLMQPIAALPLQIFTYAISPYDDWRRQAWAGALVLVGIVLLLSLGARTLARRPGQGG